MFKLKFLAAALTLALVASVSGHGRLMKPPNRSSIWRLPEYSALNPPPNYNDNALYCGQVHQAENPGTNCGVCGDPLSAPTPRDNEHGGVYGRGIVTGRYSAGQVIDVEVELTATHLGFMEFRLCTNRANERSQDCFDEHLLELEGGGGETRVEVTENRGHARAAYYNVRLMLPPNVRCTECVLQWNYRTGNRWGQCENGSIGAGCGPQETFRGCADIVIS